MTTVKKRKGQHNVRALIRVYSDEGAEALKATFTGPTERETIVRALDSTSYRVYEVDWMPRPSINEWNTESDWRRKITKGMEGLYFDVIIAEYSWKPVSP